MKIEPYVHFSGRAEEALAFYEKALGARIEMKMRYSESPDSVPGGVPAGFETKIMHSCLLIGGAPMMLSDSLMTGEAISGISLCLQYGNEPQARQAFEALAEGGRILIPMGPTFFSPCYGAVNDRFGVRWMVMVATQQRA